MLIYLQNGGGGMWAGSRRLAIALAGDIIRVEGSRNSFAAGGGGKVRSHYITARLPLP
ncbi:hypothetical protein H4N54_22870 [Limnospira fusiformis KN01]|uniref:Uncharacterized protein n=1 Tax=Limnospira fusiformis PMC 851.14 TaxID=2219512 RepID=A0ABU9ESZ3_LIMFS|nr:MULTISPECIES: hypothetical protein [Limnospira]MDT9200898.1 hypothetical protein [Limnospira sp. PMC 1042.18]MDT9236632.1 hypothetical protein [Limnospira sp. PMC 917.15]ULB45215.1 hypothetical protein H4N54_22870 [Limnospira fusiformis KN01]